MSPLLLSIVQVPDPVGEPAFRWWFLFTVLKMIGLFTVWMIGVAYMTLAERRISAWIQDRRGPNRVGPHGLGQPLADGVKNIMKEWNIEEQMGRTFHSHEFITIRSSNSTIKRRYVIQGKWTPT
jgi:NADH:ubiquinone oxidoreductase subunit H